MVFELREAHRRINRHRYAARHQDAEEAEKIVAAGGQHDGHGLSRYQSAPGEFAGHRRGAGNQPGIADIFGGVVFAVEMNLQLIGVTLDMPVDHLQQRSRFSGHALIGMHRQRLHGFRRFCQRRFRT
jgi:hypothetical protein